MKKILPIVCVVALAATLGFPQDPVNEDAGAPDLTERVDALEKEVVTLTKDLKATRALLDDTLGYLHAQADASKELMAALDSSEKAGFVPGINFRSREILLGGLRTWGSVQTAGLPQTPVKKPEAKKGTRPAPKGD